MAPSLVIRPAQPEDAAAVARVHIAGWQEAYAGLLPHDFLAGLPESFDRRRRFWEETARTLGGRGVFFVADIGGEVGGFVQGGESRDHPNEGVGEITAIYLLPAHWGKGIGRQLFATAVDRLRDADFHSAVLWVLDTNARARRFYEAAGWAPDGAEKEERVGDVILREVRYRTEL